MMARASSPVRCVNPLVEARIRNRGDRRGLVKDTGSGFAFGVPE